MRVSIRARLTLWYGFVLLIVLVATGWSILTLHARLGLADIDRQLQNRAATVAAEVRQELEEGETLDESVQEVEDIELPETGVAIVDEEDVVLVFRDVGLLQLGERVVGARDDAVTLDARPFDVRLWPEPLLAGERELRVFVWTSLEAYTRERAGLRQALLLGVPLALLIAIAGGWSISRRALHPLTDLASQAESITNLHPTARLSPPNPNDELGTLAGAFNALLDRLAGALELQRRFMSDASHELRTPVSVVRTTTQVTLDREQRPEEEYREALMVIAQQADRMSKMVDGMFTLALADAEGRPLQTSRFYLDELVEECARAAQALGRERQVDVIVTTAGECPFSGDEELLREMLMNLLDNAVRHARSDEASVAAAGRVEVTLSTADGEACIVIDDTGPGIQESDRERIFERFVRVGSAASRSGGGLGLPIARWASEAHGGAITVDASPAGGGRFIVTLPLSSAPR